MHIIARFCRLHLVFLSLFSALWLAHFPVVKAQEIPTGPAMWRVVTAESTLYILGTFHLLTPDMEWQSDRIMDAFNAADTVTFETSSEQSDPSLISFLVEQEGRYQRNNSLEKNVSPELWQSLMMHAARTGIPQRTLQSMKPWLAASTITLQSAMLHGFRPEFGVETVLEHLSIARGVPVDGLELAQEQLSALARLPKSTQVEMLSQSLEEYDTVMEKFDEMSSAWLAGDETKLTRILVDDLREYPDLFEAIYVERNEKWVPQLDEKLKQRGIHFVAVGTAHLVGPESVIQGLVNLGHVVERY